MKALLSKATGNILRVDITAGTIIKTIALLFAAYFIFILRDTILIVLTAIVIASAIEPLIKWFKTLYVDRIYAVLIIYLTGAILVFGFIYFLLPSLFAQVQSVVQQLPTIVETIPTGEPDTVTNSFTKNLSLDSILVTLQQSSMSFFDSSTAVFNAIFGGLVSFALIVVISFYLAVQDDGVANFLRVVTPRSYESYVINLWHRTQKKIGAWLQGQLILSVIVGTLSFIGLLILGVPNALLLAIIAAVFELIPLFGAILAAIPAIAVGFIDGGLHLGLIVAAVYFVIQQLENHVFHPIVVKKVVGVPALVVIIAIVVGGQLGGFLGIILAVPLAAGLLELLDDLEQVKISSMESLAIWHNNNADK